MLVHIINVDVEHRAHALARTVAVNRWATDRDYGVSDGNLSAVNVSVHDAPRAFAESEDTSQPIDRCPRIVVNQMGTHPP